MINPVNIQLEKARVTQLITFLARDASIGTWELLRDLEAQMNMQYPIDIAEPPLADSVT
jgi:hypothetical protein